MENQRIRVSKRLLKEALLDILHQKDINKVTVREICTRAEVNRTTFYKYYGSQYDLLEDIQKDMFNELEELLQAGNVNGSDDLTQTLTYIERERKTTRLLMNMTTDQDFSEKLFNLAAIKERLRIFSFSGYSEKQSKYLNAFFCHGGYAIVRRWINAEERETPEELSQLIYSLMQKLIYKSETASGAEKQL